jgi:threonine dehydrogenase-like Zn-dependent dehydrogenase
MKALVLQGKESITYQSLPDPIPQTGEVVLRVSACAVCGSDRIRYLRGHHTLPVVLGHEFSGRVIAVGTGVDPDWQGRRAAAAPLVPCYECEFCLEGRYSACRQYTFIGSSRQGGMAEMVAVPAQNLVAINEDVNDINAALMEPVTVGIHALSLGAFHPGKTVAVLGAGSIGLLLIHWLKYRKAAAIFATDLVKSRLAQARALGADLALMAGAEALQEIQSAVPGGVDLVVETAGSPHAIQHAIEILKPGGDLVLVGNQPPDRTLPLSLIEKVMRKEGVLHGSFMSFSAPFPGREWFLARNALNSGGVSPEQVVTEKLPLSEGEAYFKRLRMGDPIPQKTVFVV